MPVRIQDRPKLEQEIDSRIRQLERNLRSFICFGRKLKTFRLNYLKDIKARLDAPEELSYILSGPSIISDDAILGKTANFIRTQVLPALITTPVIPIAEQAIAPFVELASSLESATASPPVPKNKKITLSPEQATKLIFFTYKQHKQPKPQVLKAEQYPEELIPKLRKREIIDMKKYQQYVGSFDDKNTQRVMKYMHNFISRISFDKFLQQLTICVNDLEKHLAINTDQSEVILLSNDVGHSQEWVNKLVHPRIITLLKDRRVQTINIPHPPKGRQDELIEAMLDQIAHTGSVTNLYFDDCSYSGKQIREYVNAIVSKLSLYLDPSRTARLFNKVPAKGIINFIFVIPYMKKSAVDTIKSFLDNNGKPFSKGALTINCKLITSGVIGRIKDLPIDENDKKIFMRATHTYEEKPLTITDWKMPDYVSFPNFFMEGIPCENRAQKKQVRFLSEDSECKPYSRLY